ncbi:MAG: hypothetical protein Q4C12_02705 [Clostridia bacterium]|nr:hypothetical protein [Clostridia bacterium]
MTAHYFAGANTADGFCDFFMNILPEELQKKVYYIKGGPGVGKSTFMRAIGEALEKNGYDVEYFHCSGDPDSIDGVAAPAIGAALMDGTAPHVCDPSIPGARDTLVSLGDFLDVRMLSPYCDEIKSLNKTIGTHYKRAYRFFAAAAALAEPKAESCQLEFFGAKLRHLFLSAYTLKGKVEFACPHKRLVSLNSAPSDAAELMRHCKAATLFHNPLIPKNIDSIYLPDSETLIVCKQSEPKGLCAEALRMAQGELLAAKDLHDKLEAFYIKACDFARVDKMRKKVEKAILA